MLRAKKKPRRTWSRLGSGLASDLVLAAEWRAWVAENTLRDLPRTTLIETLCANGVSPDLALREVDSIARSPVLAGARPLAREAKRLELVMSLQRQLAGLANAPGGIARRERVSGDEFFDRYYATCTPVVLTDVMNGWKALTSWSPAYFKERAGDCQVEIVSGRESDPDYDMNFKAHLETTTMAEYADRVLGAGSTNDFYFTANNRNTERSAFAALKDDFTIPSAYLDPGRREGCTSLWFGPAGTVTPLHHDTCNILFCQVLGKKRVTLISPVETSLLKNTRGVYSPIDCEDPDLTAYPDFKDVVKHEVVLAPGEALFIPVSWWHHVRALEVSINVSFTNFLRSNAFAWYAPGAVF